MKRRHDYSFFYKLAGIIIGILAVVLLAVTLIQRGKASSSTAQTGGNTEAAAASDAALAGEAAASADNAAEGTGTLSAEPAADSMSAETASAESTSADSTAADSTAAESASADSQTASAASSAEGTEPAKDEIVSITISATGDVTLGMDAGASYDSSMNAKYEEVGYPGWFFENVRDIFENDDLTIVNFEGTLTTSNEREDKQYAFKADPSWVEILTEGGVDAANLANNHAFDYGYDAYEDTKKYLTDAGIVNFGYDRSQIVEVKGIKVGLVGTLALFDEVDVLLDQAYGEIDKLRADGAQLIICSVHWGDEAHYDYTYEQADMGRALVDYGADLVIGHHPHRLQKHEIYNGKHIFYSLGNFCFGGHSSPSDLDTAIAQQTFTFKNGVLQDTDEVNIIPCRISSTTEYNNYQPTPMDDEDAKERVRKKLNGEWS